MATPSHRAAGTNDRNGSNGPTLLTPLNLLLVLIVFTLLTSLTGLLVSVLMALLLGTLLEGPVQRLEKRALPRAAAIAVCYIGVLAGLVALVFIILPVVQDQASEFRETFPTQMQELRDDWSTSSNPLLRGSGVDLLDTGISFIESPDDASNVNVTGDTAAAALPIVGTVIGAFASLITTLVITFYYLLEKKLVRRVVIDQVSPENQARISALWTSVESKVGGWLRGQLILCLIIGVTATTFYGIVGLEFWPLLGLWAGITEIIPILGPWLGAIPAVLVALTMGPEMALVVAVFFLVMQSLENWVLVPRVMRGAVGLTPLTVFVAIIAGTQLMGITGAILAIPIAAGLQVVLSEYMNQRRSRFQIEPVQGSGWRWMLNRARDKGYESPSSSEESDFGTQVESDVSYSPDEDAAEPETPEDDVYFEEAPRMLVDAEKNGDDTSRAAESTWPTNPWKPGTPARREGSPWRAAYRPGKKDSDTE